MRPMSFIYHSLQRAYRPLGRAIEAKRRDMQQERFKNKEPRLSEMQQYYDFMYGQRKPESP